ncbi:MAG TPA: hypothetical protein VJZ16_02410, partial [Syntrophales bacterium]|nr:hypothetical protein [Syntrophales bacterium]
IAETKGKGEALLVLDEIQNTVVAIEVKSGSRKEGLPGMDAFDKTFQPQRKLLAGGDGIPLEKFMLTPAAEWVA